MTLCTMLIRYLLLIVYNIITDARGQPGELRRTDPNFLARIIIQWTCEEFEVCICHFRRNLARASPI